MFFLNDNSLIKGKILLIPMWPYPKKVIAHPL